MLARALAEYSTTSSLPLTVAPTLGILGPIGEKADLVNGDTATRVESFEAIATAAAAAVVAIGAATATRAQHIPYEVTIGSSAVNSGEMLLAMAFAIQKLRTCGMAKDGVAVARATLLPPYASLIPPVYGVADDTLPLWYAKLQLWTVKPAPFKCSL